MATSTTSEGSAPNSMLLLSRILSSGPRAEAGTAGTGSGRKTSSGASGNGLGWTAGIWGATMAGVEVANYFVCAGMNGNSLQGAGGVGKAVADWIVKGYPPGDMLNFEVQRF